MGEGETTTPASEGEHQMADVRKIIGDPARIAEQMEAFRESVALLSSESSRMTEEYPDEWIGIHSGKVRAQGPTFESVLKALDEGGYSRAQAIIRYIEAEPRPVVL